MSTENEIRQIITDQITRHVAMSADHRAWLARDIGDRVSAALLAAQSAREVETCAARRRQSETIARQNESVVALQADNARLRTALQMMQDKTQWVPFAFETADERAAANVLISSALSSPPPASSASPKGTPQ